MLEKYFLNNLTINSNKTNWSQTELKPQNYKQTVVTFIIQIIY